MPQPSTVGPADAPEELARAPEVARRLLGRRSAARRAELAEGLQELTEAVAAALRMFSDDSGPLVSDSETR